MLAQPLLEDVHRGRQRHHHLHHLRKPVDVVRDGFYRGSQLQGIPVAARFEWYVPEKGPEPRGSAQVRSRVVKYICLHVVRLHPGISSVDDHRYSAGHLWTGGRLDRNTVFQSWRGELCPEREDCWHRRGPFHTSR